MGSLGTRSSSERVRIYDEVGSPIDDPSSPTKDKGKGRGGTRSALAEMTPGTVARRDGRPTGQPPPLSARPARQQRQTTSQSQVGRDLAVVTKDGDDWGPDDVRFVLWYHCRTSLKFDAIAAKYNATYAEADPIMNAADAEAIVDTVKLNWNQVKGELGQTQSPLPLDPGWHLCDHHMTCSEMCYEDKRTLMRHPRTRVGGIGLMKEIVTTIWSGSWEELLQCPRNHGGAQEGETANLAGGSTRSNTSQQRVPNDQHDRESRSPTRESARGNTDNNQVRNPGGNNVEDEPDLWNDWSDHPFRYAVRLLGGPKVLWHFMGYFLRLLFLFWLVTDRPPLLPPAGHLHEASSPSREEFLLMVYGGWRMLDDIEKFLEFEVLIFRGVNEPPPLSIIQHIFWTIAGCMAASGFARWQGWVPKEMVLERIQRYQSRSGQI